MVLRRHIELFRTRVRLRLLRGRNTSRCCASQRPPLAGRAVSNSPKQSDHSAIHRLQMVNACRMCSMIDAVMPESSANRAAPSGIAKVGGSDSP